MAPADSWNWGEWGLKEERWGPFLVGSLGLSCRYKRFLFYLSCSSRLSTKYFFFLTVHYLNSFVPIAQQAGQAAVLGRLSLSVCLWSKPRAWCTPLAWPGWAESRLIFNSSEVGLARLIESGFKKGCAMCVLPCTDPAKDCLIIRTPKCHHLKKLFFFGGGGFFLFIFFVLYSALLHLPPLRFHCADGAGIEPMTVATGALAVRRSNH